MIEERGGVTVMKDKVLFGKNMVAASALREDPGILHEDFDA